MKKLVRILLVNWYRLESLSLNISGHAAFIGPNTSGKSSLLDAVQLVLIGGDFSRFKSNPSAGEKSTRTVREYCLGIIQDQDNPDLSEDFRARDQAITYLVLCFEDSETRQEISIGLAISATRANSKADVDGRFIVPAGLVLSDLVETLGNQKTPKPWKRLHEELRQRHGQAYQYTQQSSRFVEMFCAELNDGRRSIEPQRFLRSLRNAITFAPINNISEFVRTYILEPNTIDIERLRKELSTYEDIQANTLTARDKLAQLEVINKHYGKADQQQRLALIYRWITQEARFNALEAKIGPLREELSNKESEAEQLVAEIESLKQRDEQANEKLTQAQIRLAQTEVEQNKKRIESDRKFELANKDGADKELKKSRQGFSKLFMLLDRLEKQQALPALQTLAKLVAPDTALLWPEQPHRVMDAIKTASPELESLASQLREKRKQQESREEQLKADLETQRKQIERLESGQSVLSDATLVLQKLLAEQGIQSVPLCDKVDVQEDSWRDAIESFLGNQRESLLVAPQDVESATRIYRAARRDLYGAHIVNTTRTAEWLSRSQSGSLAELLRTEDEHARAYLNRLCGNVIRAQTEQELKQHERALTRDGMLATNNAITRLQPKPHLLGQQARARRLETLRQTFQEKSGEYGEVQRARQEAENVLDNLIPPLRYHIEHLPGLAELAGKRAQAEERLRQLVEEEGMLNSGDYDHLKAEIEKLEKLRKEIQAQQNSAQKRYNALLTELGKIQNYLESRVKEQEDVASLRTEAQGAPGLDMLAAVEKLAELEQAERAQLVGGEEARLWKELSTKAESRAAQEEKRCRDNRQNAWEALANYLARWQSGNTPSLELGESGQQHHILAAWVLKTMSDIHDSQLAQYATEAETALRIAQDTFRSDFVGRLQENLQQLEIQRRELNRNLKKHPFHGKYYSFIKKPATEFDVIRAWVESWTPEQGGDVGGLFDAARNPSHPHQEAMQRVQAMLREGKDNALADYRNYYIFDVMMADAPVSDEGQEKPKNPERLSQKLGKGSGGEHQSPFYVAIGASLAATYRLERDADNRLRGGMALAVFDEAFSKLDEQNSENALAFLDELGLQVLLAAPDGKYGIMAEHVDTIVNVYRDGAIVHVDTEYPKQAARDLLAADNPLKQR